MSGEVLSNETYHYENELIPYALTGITDSAGIRYASWTYDDQGRGISSEHAGGVDRTTIEFDEDTSRDNNNWINSVTSPLGRVSNYNIEAKWANRRYLVKSVDGEASLNCVADAKSMTHQNGFDATIGSFSLISSATDKEGRVTNYSYDAKGRRANVTQASGTPEETTTLTEWHPIYRLPVSRTVNGLITDYTYDDAGRMLSMTQTDTDVPLAL